MPTPPQGVGRTQQEAKGLRLLAGLAFLGTMVAASISLVALGVTRNYLEERGRPHSLALQVEDASYPLRYVANRLRLYVEEVGGVGSVNARPESALTAVIDTIVEEEVLRRFAHELGVEASPQEVEEAIRARLGLTEPVAEGEQDPFPSLYQRELARTGLTDSQYRAMVEAQLLRNKAQGHFYDQTPSTAESVRYRRIVLRGPAEAVIARLKAGEDFAQVAKEVSLDQLTRAQGGEVGWIPRGVLDPALEEVLFSLQVGEIGSHVDPQTGFTYILQVEERAPSHPLGPPERQALASKALRSWLGDKRSALNIVNKVDPVLGDPKKVGWVLKEVYG